MPAGHHRPSLSLHEEDREVVSLRGSRSGMGVGGRSVDQIQDPVPVYVPRPTSTVVRARPMDPLPRTHTHPRACHTDARTRCRTLQSDFSLQLPSDSDLDVLTRVWCSCRKKSVGTGTHLLVREDIVVVVRGGWHPPLIPGRSKDRGYRWTRHPGRRNGCGGNQC